MTQVDSEWFAKNIKISTLKMVSKAKSSHIGSCLSIADIIAVLYSEVLVIDPANPQLTNRDRFILSKGHACAVVYAALAESGFFDKSQLETYGADGSNLMAHISHKVPGVEFSTGSLGHGLPFAVGKALAAKKSSENWRTFVLLGDGELDEGSNWEALLFAAHHKLSNLTVIIDRNNLQSLTTTDETLNLEPLKQKFEAFGIQVTCIDGHSHGEIVNALSENLVNQTMPKVVIAKTLKGKGVDFMEGTVEWHYRSPDPIQLEIAINQVKGQS